MRVVTAMRGLATCMRNTSMVRKIIMISVSMIIIPLIMTGIIYYVTIRSLVQDEMKSTYGQIAEQYVDGIEYKLNIYANLLTTISNADTVQDFLANPNENDLYLDMEADQKMGRLIDNLCLSDNYDEIKQIVIYIRDGDIGIGSRYIDSMSHVDPTGWPAKVNMQRRRLQWVTGSEKDGIISFIKPISSIKPDNRLSLIGAVKLDLDQEETFRIADQKTGGMNSPILTVTDDEGNVIYTQQGDGQADPSQQILITRAIDFRSWTATFAFPVRGIENRILQVIKLVAVSIAIFGAFSICIVILFSRSFSRRFQLLLKKMDRVKEGNLELSYRIEGEDEIGIADRNFNEMVSLLKESIKQNYLQQIEKREAELKALQFQINPHFLYNTLECIHAMALVNGSREIGVAVLRLGEMLRYNLSTDLRETVLLKEELKQVRNYVDIQRIRFGSQFTVMMDVPDDLLTCRIPKFILQPLIENVVQHGFQHAADHFYAEITAEAGGGVLQLIVMDDGAGISGDRLEQINDSLHGGHSLSEAGGGRSIGLQNVNARIRLRYGEPFGVVVESEENAWTTVIIRVPVEKGE